MATRQEEEAEKAATAAGCSRRDGTEAARGGGARAARARALGSPSRGAARAGSASPAKGASPYPPPACQGLANCLQCQSVPSTHRSW